MNDQQWAELCGRIEATFRGGLQDDREHELLRHFGKVPFELAERCIERLVHTGHVFVPTPGEMVGALRGVTGGGWEFDCAINGQTSEERHALLEETFVRRHPRLLDGGSDERF